MAAHFRKPRLHNFFQLSGSEAGSGASSSSSSVAPPVQIILVYFAYTRAAKPSITVTHVFALVERAGVELKFLQNPSTQSFRWQTQWQVGKRIAEEGWPAIYVHPVELQRTPGPWRVNPVQNLVTGGIQIWPKRCKVKGDDPFKSLEGRSDAPAASSKRGGFGYKHPRVLWVDPTKGDGESSGDSSSAGQPSDDSSTSLRKPVVNKGGNNPHPLNI